MYRLTANTTHTAIRVATAVCALAFFTYATSATAQTRTMSDQGISDQVEEELMFDQGVLSTNVRISTTDGIVTLRGTVDNLLAKERAARLAETVRGVRSVINRIKVSPRAMHKDDEITENIEAAWLADPATESYEVSARVNNGNVILTGTVESYQEKELAATVAKGVSGVRSLDNQIEVDYQQVRSDLEIKNEIEEALKWDVNVEYSGLVDVKVNDGRVTLTGTAGSVAERRRMLSKSWVAGVTDVDVSKVKIQDWADDEQRRNKRIPSISDAEMEQAIKDALLYDPRVNMFDVKVEVTGGRATLRGTVDNVKARRAALQVARNTYGVWHVYDRLKVQSQAGLSDAQIKDRIVQALARDALVESYEITANVHDGNVDLYGTVDTFFEKSQADDVVSRVNGVIDVDNHLVVSDLYEPYIYDPYVDSTYPYDYDWYHYEPSGTFESDQTIEAEIEDELWWSPFVDADEVDVDVDNGIATLTGSVDSWHERQSAAENAYEGGAVSVINKLTITD